MIRVIVADDSPTARQLLVEMLHSDPGIRVVAEARDGLEAIDLVARHRPDVVLMDVHMPAANGLEATREIMVRAPTPIVIVSAAATRDDVDLSLSATQAGALIALPKPEGPDSPRFQELRQQIIAMVRSMSQVKVVRRWSSGAPGTGTLPARPARRPAGLIAIAASTGGPPALRQLLGGLPADFHAPILVVQHIARDFTAGFADWLDRGAPVAVALAQHGEPLRPGRVYVAPDDRHLGVGARRTVELSATPPLGGFRPSATHLFRSAATAYGEALAAVVLTGMGTDGAAGLAHARARGAYVLAQDRDSSIVFGMADEAIRRGLVDTVLPLDRIADRLVELAAGGEHAA
jgi:two-component system, chemotaxis family, protein-glutamate methylesterase/glutaminase